MNDDRTVHASTRGMELVRYDRAGKWYLEIAENYGRPGLPAERLQVTFGEAVDTAKAWLERGDGTIYPGRHGGKAFDNKVTL